MCGILVILCSTVHVATACIVWAYILTIHCSLLQCIYVHVVVIGEMIPLALVTIES